MITEGKELSTEMDSVPFKVPYLDKDGKEGLRTIRIMLDDLDEISKGIRPKGMGYMAYHSIRAQVKKVVKKKLRGELIHMSKMTSQAWMEFLIETKSGYIPQKGRTYIKKDSKDGSDKSD